MNGVGTGVTQSRTDAQVMTESGPESLERKIPNVSIIPVTSLTFS